MDNLRGVLGVRRIDKMRNERIRELCGVKKGVNKRINESMLRWFGHVERMNGSRLVKRMYSGDCVGNRPAGRPKRKWIESVNECLKERNVSLAEARIKVHDCLLYTSPEPTRLLSISYAVFCLKKKKIDTKDR